MAALNVKVSFWAFFSADVKTPQAWRMGRYFRPQPTRGPRERRELPQRGPGRT